MEGKAVYEGETPGPPGERLEGPAEAGRVWARALADLQGQMAQATFDRLLRGSEVVAVGDGAWTIRVRHAAAADWLQNRLGATIGRTVHRLAGRDIALTFAPPASRGMGSPIFRGTPSPHPPASGLPDAGEAEVEVQLHMDPALASFDVATAGWSKLANYAIDYWAELLGPAAFLTWLAIRSEDTRRRKTPWTPILRFSVSRLARLAAASNRQAITGVMRRCTARSILENDRPCEHCAERHGEHLAPHTCQFWRPGAFDVLQTEGVALVRRTGRGLATVYRIRVFNTLPLLTPAQVARLHPATQEQHDRWLRRQDLDAEQWEKLTAAHLALPPFSPG